MCIYEPSEFNLPEWRKSEPQHCHLFRRFLHFLYFESLPECHDVFLGSVVLFWLTQKVQLSYLRTYVVSKTTHKNTYRCNCVGSRTSCISNVFLFRTHIHTHAHTLSSRCSADERVCMLCSWCTPQNSGLRSSWLITSCFLFPTLLLPVYWTMCLLAQVSSTNMPPTQNEGISSHT